MDRRKNIAVVTVALLALAGPRAHALQLVDLSPRGEVARVRQVVATFDEPAVDFGDPRAPAPFTVRRDDAQAGKGTPRWTGAKRWVFDFAAELPPGVRCTVERVAGFRSASGAALKAPERSCFDTGGPSVRTLWPAGEKIDERQTFVLELSGAATPASLREHVWCAADGPGERIPVALVEGAERDAVLQAVGRDKAARAEPSRFAALRCNRTLTAGGRVQVVYGQGGRDAPGRGQPRGAALRLRGPRTLRLRARERAGRVPAAAPHDAALQRAGHAGDRRAQPPRRPRRRPPPAASPARALGGHRRARRRPALAHRRPPACARRGPQGRRRRPGARAAPSDARAPLRTAKSGERGPGAEGGCGARERTARSASRAARRCALSAGWCDRRWRPSANPWP